LRKARFSFIRRRSFQLKKVFPESS
jgi:hypothetical protein